MSLELGSLALVKPVIERLIATVSRDTIDGSEVWQTIAFMLLDSLVQLSGLEKQHIVLSTLVGQGILTNLLCARHQGVRFAIAVGAETGSRYIPHASCFSKSWNSDDLNPLDISEAFNE